MYILTSNYRSLLFRVLVPRASERTGYPCVPIDSSSLAKPRKATKWGGCVSHLTTVVWVHICAAKITKFIAYPLQAFSGFFMPQKAFGPGLCYGHCWRAFSTPQNSVFAVGIWLRFAAFSASVHRPKSNFWLSLRDKQFMHV